MQNQENSAIKKFLSQLQGIYKRVQNLFDWNKIDAHSSLTFLQRNYQKKPSDIARIILYVLAYVVLSIEGLRVLTILMCYLLPIGIMILKICEVMKNKKKKSPQPKNKLKDSEFQQKSFDKSESVLSINSKHNDPKGDSQQEQELKNKAKTQEITVNDLCKVFIFYFVVNLAVELFEPILLLIVQTFFSLGSITIESIQELIVDGNFWVLLFIPFRLISTFFAQIFSFNQANAPAVITLILLRVLLSAFLLNLNREQKNYCTKLLFEQKVECLSAEILTHQKPKKQ